MGSGSMFAFLSAQAREGADPLLNQKNAAAWLRQLPANDVIGRQQQVLATLESLRRRTHQCKVMIAP